MSKRIMAVRLAPSGVEWDVALECGHTVRMLLHPRPRDGGYARCVVCARAYAEAVKKAFNRPAEESHRRAPSGVSTTWHRALNDTGWLPIDLAPRDGTRVHREICELWKTCGYDAHPRRPRDCPDCRAEVLIRLELWMLRQSVRKPAVAVASTHADGPVDDVS